MPPLSAAVSRMRNGVKGRGAVDTNAFHSYYAYWYMRALDKNGNELSC